MIFVLGVWAFLRALLVNSAAVSLENMALRHQLSVLQRSVRRPRFRRRDRIFWLWVARLWAGWRASLVIVQPATVLAWHRQGFQLYWRWKSRRRPVGRPPLDLELRTLICRMARENPTFDRDSSVVEVLRSEARQAIGTIGAAEHFEWCTKDRQDCLSQRRSECIPEGAR